jgi:hypothetical protein
LNPPCAGAEGAAEPAPLVAEATGAGVDEGLGALLLPVEAATPKLNFSGAPDPATTGPLLPLSTGVGDELGGAGCGCCCGWGTGVGAEPNAETGLGAAGAGLRAAGVGLVCGLPNVKPPLPPLLGVLDPAPKEKPFC